MRIITKTKLYRVLFELKISKCSVSYAREYTGCLSKNVMSLRGVSVALNRCRSVGRSNREIDVEHDFQGQIVCLSRRIAFVTRNKSLEGTTGRKLKENVQVLPAYAITFVICLYFERECRSQLHIGLFSYRKKYQNYPRNYNKRAIAMF